MAYASSIKERELAKLRTLRAEFAERAEVSRRKDRAIWLSEKARAQDEMDWGNIKATSYRIKMGGRK
jgi:hypothetical protein